MQNIYIFIFEAISKTSNDVNVSPWTYVWFNLMIWYFSQLCCSCNPLWFSNFNVKFVFFPLPVFWLNRVRCARRARPHCKLPAYALSLSQNLALCTAALMYILSRDRLNMDLDRACLELMIKLLELDQDHLAHQDQLTAKEVEKEKEKIRKLCATVHNKHLDLENITVGGAQQVEKIKKIIKMEPFPTTMWILTVSGLAKCNKLLPGSSLVGGTAQCSVNYNDLNQREGKRRL